MKDRAGREIEVGSSVDVYLDGRFSAQVVECSDGGIIGPNGAEPAKLVLMVPIPYRYPPGAPAECYVIRGPQKTEEKNGE